MPEFLFDSAHYSGLIIKIDWSKNSKVIARQAMPIKPEVKLRHGFSYQELNLKTKIIQKKQITEIEILSFPENLTWVHGTVRCVLDSYYHDKIAMSFKFRVQKGSWPK